MTRDCSSRYEEYISLFLKKGVVDYSEYLTATTPFKIALKNSQIEVAKFILEYIPSYSRDKYENTVLHIAIYYDCIEIVQELLEKKELINIPNRKGQTPLHFAIFYNRPNIVEKLLEYKADINANTCFQGTPFYCAILFYMPNIEKFFNAKPNIKGFVKGGPSFLHWAADKLNINAEILNKLLPDYDKEIKAIINNLENNDGLTALHLAAKNGNYDLAKFLIEMKADVNFITPTDKQTPLFYAVIYERLEIIELLIANKANIDAVNVQGQTALHCILQNLSCQHLGDDRIELIKKLIIVHKANINIADAKGQTPLRIAVKGNLKYAVEVLLNNNAKLNSSQNFNIILEQDPLLHIAILNRNLGILNFLLEYSIKTANYDHEVAYVDSVDKFDRTALHVAVEKGLLNFVEKLLKSNANIDVMDKQGDRPIDIAQRKGYKPIVNLINIQSLHTYLKELSQRPDSHRRGLFGYTAGDKRKAAEALKRVVCDSADPDCLEEHKKALNQGKLGKIYSSLSSIIKEISLNRTSSIEIKKH